MFFQIVGEFVPWMLRVRVNLIELYCYDCLSGRHEVQQSCGYFYVLLSFMLPVASPNACVESEMMAKLQACCFVEL